MLFSILSYPIHGVYGIKYIIPEGFSEAKRKSVPLLGRNST